MILFGHPDSNNVNLGLLLGKIFNADQTEH